jgi:DNA-binding transcriptional LysR family regulator
MDTKQLKIFSALVESGSFSKAATALSLSQPTISFQINGLEKEIGARLFERTTKKLRLTAEGKLLYEYAKRILALEGQIREEINSCRGLKKGELSIGASNIPGVYILPELLGGFKKKYPGIKIDLKIMDTQQILTQVLENKVDLGVVGSITKDSRLVFERFCKDELVLIASNKSQLAKKRYIPIKELKELPFILREQGSGTREVIRENLLKKGIRLSELRVEMQLGNNEAVKKAVAADLGVSFVSKFSIGQELRLGLLKICPVESLSIRRFFYIVRFPDSLSSPTKALRSFLFER